MALHAVPQNVAYYQTAHLAHSALHNQNQGVLMGHRWFPFIRGCRKILEVGCGNGKACEWLSTEYAKQMTGVDLVAGPYVRGGYEFVTLDIQEQELPRGFDAAISFDVLEHMETGKVGEVLANIDKSAPMLILQIAGYDAPPEHLTVKSPGWWLNMFYNHMAGREWLVQVFRRYKDRESPVYLFMGIPV